METIAPTQLERDSQHERRDYYANLRDQQSPDGDPRCCPQGCGSLDGMMAIPRESFDDARITATAYYRLLYSESPHDLFIPCPICNRWEHIPAGYEWVTPAWIRAWLARPCQCNDCRRERGESYWRQKWPLEDDPNAMELVDPREERGQTHVIRP